MGIITNAGKVAVTARGNEGDKEQQARKGCCWWQQWADGDISLSGWRRRSQNCNGNNYDCNGVVIKIMES